MWNSDEKVNLLIEWPSAGLGLDNDTVWILCPFSKEKINCEGRVFIGENMVT